VAEHTVPDDAGRDAQARFEAIPGTGQQPPTVRAAGDIDLINVDQFRAALDEAGAAAGEITADMTAVTYCDSAAIHALFTAARQRRLTVVVGAASPVTTMLKLAGLDHVATVVTE